jgi:uncharacterized RDD family membrane protein YckC
VSDVLIERPTAAVVGLVYAPWYRRIASAFIDFYGLAILGSIFRSVGPDALFVVLEALAVAWGLFNALLAGLSGQSFGKRAMGVRLIDRETQGLIGGRRAILRVVAHLADSIPMGVGYVAPLFDRERRCFADMIMKTVVVMMPHGEA